MPSSLIVPVATIDALDPHPNADSLMLAQILGWQMVVAKDACQVGDKTVYVPPDTVLPQELSDKLGVTNYLDRQRVRCIKLRGEPSFGLAFPPAKDWPVGENVAEYYGLTKWEPPLRSWGRSGVKEKPKDWLPEHPLFPQYTHIENLRNFPDIFEDDEWIVLTEKIHGTNVRIGVVEGEVMAGSHKMRRKMPESEEQRKDNLYWFPHTLPCVKTFLEVALERSDYYKQVVLYGEVYGSPVQSFHYGLHGTLGFRAFDLVINGKYLDYDKFVRTCDIFEIPTVPLVKKISFTRERVRALSSGMSMLFSGEEKDHHIREGVVVRPIEERSHRRVGRVVMKYLSDDYLFAKKSDYAEV